MSNGGPAIGNQPFPPFPYYAFVDLKIQNFDFTPIPPEHLLSFDVSFKGDVGELGLGEGSFTVFDETALRIEHALWRAASDTSGAMLTCYFNFGYAETEHVSPTYAYLITDYDLTLKASGSELTVKMVSQGMAAHGLPKTLAYNTHDEDMTLVEIIEDIAEKSGWEIDEIQVLEDLVVDGDDNNGTPVKKYKEIRLDNISTTHGMINKVLAICRGKDDDNTSVVMSFIDEGEGKVKVRVTSWGYDAATGDVVKEYSFPWDGQLGEVISFSPKFTGAMMFAGAASIDCDAYDEDTMEPVAEEHDAFTVPGKYLIGGREVHITETDAYMIPNYSSGIREELKRKANYLWEKSELLSYEATMEILGDPYLKDRDLISIIVRTPSGLAHHTSGVYLIKALTHNISGGKWTTTLELFREPAESMMEIPGMVTGEHQNQPSDPSREEPDHYNPVPEDYAPPKGPEQGM